MRGKYDVYAVGTDTAKELLFARLLIDRPGPGYCHFSKPHNDEVYFFQLTAEKLRTRHKDGRPVYFWWKPDNRRNEALDCRVYAMAALKSLLAMGVRLEGRPKPAPSAATPAAAATKGTGGSAPARVTRVGRSRTVAPRGSAWAGMPGSVWDPGRRSLF
jgi:phage terminase large subunit GpA-like protein